LEIEVNVGKSKVVIFSKGRMSKNIVFMYNTTVLEIVNEFTYLGILISRTGSFFKSKKS